MKIRNIFLSMALLAACDASAVKALQTLRSVVQPDGSVVQVQRVGDEFLHYTVNTEGQLLSLGDDGFYYLAGLDDKGLVKTLSVRATAPAELRAKVAVKLADIPASFIEKRRAASRLSLAAPAATSAKAPVKAVSKDNPYAGQGLSSTSFPRSGDVRAIVILVEYSDYAFHTENAGEYFNDMLNGDNFTRHGGTGSARRYFLDSSFEQFRPTFDVYGPVTLPRNRAYYGGNDSSGDDNYPEDMLVHAVNILDKDVDFSQYDLDGDGYVDNVFIIYAGQGEASYGPAESVWPHAWALAAAGKTRRADGVLINKYGCSNEWKLTSPDGVGTFIHEFSHVMGLPDLYCTTYSSAGSETPGAYSVLDYGPYNNEGRTPPVYSAYERNAMGWISPIILGDKATISLEPLDQSNTAALIGTTLSNEFFLVENRQNQGWDKYIPGHGMMVWHVDYQPGIFSSNRVNNTSGHQYVDIIEACGRSDNRAPALMSGYTFPGSGNVTALTAETTPALTTWAGAATGVAITEITEDPHDGLLSFNVNGGDNALDAPLVDSGSGNVSADETGFTAVWQPVDGATDYLLRVSAISEGIPETQTADMGADTDVSLVLPEGWTASTNEVYTSSNCAGDKPSYKMKTDGAWLQTRVFAGDITQLSFATRGVAAIGSTLSLLIFDGESWNDFAVITPESKITKHSFDNFPAGTHAVKFIYNRSKGNLALDDVSVTTGSKEYVLPDYNFISTGGATQQYVAAVEGVSRYRWTVRAVAGMRRSPLSEEVEVQLPQAGLGDIIADAAEGTAVWFDMQGRSLGAERPAAAGLYIRRQGAKASKVYIH